MLQNSDISVSSFHNMLIEGALVCQFHSCTGKYNMEHDGHQSEMTIRSSDSSEEVNRQFSWALLCALCWLVGIFFAVQSTLRVREYIRLLACMANDTQRHYLPPILAWAGLKKHLIYAPLLRKRHTQEPQFSAVPSTCCIPTRLQFCIIAIIALMNGCFCLTQIPWKSSTEDLLTVIRNRLGTIAVVNLIPLVLLAGRYNPLSRLLSINFDALNIIHRWLGRIVMLEAVAHAAMWIAGESERCRNLPLFGCLNLRSSSRLECGIDII